MSMKSLRSRLVRRGASAALFCFAGIASPACGDEPPKCFQHNAAEWSKLADDLRRSWNEVCASYDASKPSSVRALYKQRLYTAIRLNIMPSAHKGLIAKGSIWFVVDAAGHVVRTETVDPSGLPTLDHDIRAAIHRVYIGPPPGGPFSAVFKFDYR
jgi:hypothetical protein